MNDIQRARDVLANAREASRAAGPQEYFWSVSLDPAVKHIIMLTAGNSDLLDAIDGFLVFEEKSERVYGMVPNNFATSLAAAIIAAGERMRS